MEISAHQSVDNSYPVNSYYSVQLKKTAIRNHYVAAELMKKGKGNSPPLNYLFAWKDMIEFRRIEPVGLCKPVILFPIKYGEKSDERVLLLETTPARYPYGVVQIDDSPDCTLFQIRADNTIDFFVAEGKAHETGQLLQMLADGSLMLNINELTK